MYREELISAIAEAIELSENNRRQKEIKAALIWRVAECIIIVVISVLFAIYFASQVPVLAHDGGEYTTIQAIQAIQRAKDLETQHEYIGLSVFYATIGEMAALCLAYICASGVLVFNAFKNHTKHDSINTISLLLAIIPVVVALIEFVKTIR